jgi:hypothetical protein
MSYADDDDLYEMRERMEMQEDERAEEMDNLRATRDRYEAALRPFAHFAEMWEQKPINRASDEHIVYGIHGGTPWEGTLTLGDFRRAREALAAAQPIGDDWPQDCVDGTDNSGAVGGAAAQEGTP